MSEQFLLNGEFTTREYAAKIIEQESIVCYDENAIFVNAYESLKYVRSTLEREIEAQKIEGGIGIFGLMNARDELNSAMHILKDQTIGE